jgi:hypothetical protein
MTTIRFPDAAARDAAYRAAAAQARDLLAQACDLLAPFTTERNANTVAVVLDLPAWNATHLRELADALYPPADRRAQPWNARTEVNAGRLRHALRTAADERDDEGDR